MRYCKFIFVLVALATPYAQAVHEGVATHFQTFGYPFGACGVSHSVLASDASDSLIRGVSDLNYVALNVFHAPGDYRQAGAFGPRPLTGDATQWLGAYNNGRNCGRWVKITLGDECDGQNDGAQGQPFCRNGTGWYSDGSNGAELYAIVADQCSDDNAWCRDNWGHLDIRTEALNKFRLPSGELIPPLASQDGSGWVTSHFNNRKISWEFVRSPNYRGDISIYFSEASKPYYMRLIISNLPNGITDLEQEVGVDAQGNTLWDSARMEGDMGQMWILPKSDIRTNFRIRVGDVEGNWVAGGRVYEFDFPEACGEECTQPAVKVDYRSIGGQDESSIPVRLRPLGPHPLRSLHIRQSHDLLGRIDQFEETPLE